MGISCQEKYPNLGLSEIRFIYLQAAIYLEKWELKSVFSRDYKKFLDVLIHKRKSAKMTQQNVADILKKPQSFVSKYENGERRLDVVEFIKIARSIGASPIAIIKELEKQ